MSLQDTLVVIMEQQDFQGSKLLPSFFDRKSYFGLLLGETSEIEAISYQKRAMEVFTSRIHTEVSNAIAFGREAAEVLMELVHQTLDLMSVMFVEIINEVNMAQIFLWYYLVLNRRQAALVVSRHHHLKRAKPQSFL